MNFIWKDLLEIVNLGYAVELNLNQRKMDLQLSPLEDGEHKDVIFHTELC
jgi:hypothetical protein